MTRSVDKYFFIILFTAFVILFVSCQRKETTEKKPQTVKAKQTVQEKEETKVKPVEVPEQLQAMITFFSGDVYVSSGSDWQDASIGESLKRDDIIRVDKESYCEVQFGNTASIRIQENTEVKMLDVFLQAEINRITVGISIGAVLCKVKKLSNNDSFKVKTPTAICGVRGTQFGVRLSKIKGTIIAVKEGKVAVLPASLDVVALKTEVKEKVKEGNKLLLKIIDEMEESAPVVQPDEEITVNKKALEKTEKTYKTIVKEIDKITESKEKITSENLTSVNKLVKKIKKQVEETVAPPKKISKYSSEEIKPVEKIRIIEMPIQQVAANKEAAKKGIPVVSYEKFLISVEPKDASINLNGNFVGKGTFAGLFLPGEKLEFVIEKTGYVEKKLDIKVSKGSGRNYKFKLKEKKETIRVNVIPPDAEIVVNGKVEGEGSYFDNFEWGTKLNVSARKEGYKEKDITIDVSEGSGKTYNLTLKREKEKIAIKTVPSDAEILIDGNLVGHGSYSKDFATGEEVSIQVQRKEYLSKNMDITIERGKGKEYTVVLRPKAIPYKYSASTNKIIGKLVSYRNLLISADGYGIISAVNSDGVKLWSITTKNRPNENSSPEIAGNKLLFSGVGEFIIADALSGRIVYRKSLAGADNHMFGRRSVRYKQGVLFPTNRSIKIIDTNTGKTIKSINIPGGSKMTPAVYKGNILIVNQQGVFYGINPENGKIIRELKTQAIQPVAITVVVHGDRAYFPGRRGTIVCLNLGENKIVWQKKPSGVKSIGVFQDLTVGKKGVFMFANSTIYSFNISTGNQIFPPIHGISSPPLYHNGYLYAGTKSEELILMNEITGKIVKSIKIGAIITTRPENKQGKIIVGTNKGEIIVINSEGIK